VTAIGIVATVVIATLVPADREDHAPIAFREELKVVRRPQVLLGLLMTVLGFAGVFAVFTYIQPILTRVTGFADSAVSPILFLLGIGLIVGNLLGGRLADKRLMAALIATLAALAIVLGLMTFALHSKIAAVLFFGLFGIAAFATVPPLQLWVLQKAEGAQNLASSLNIGAFNLGNALGAWLGGVVIERGPGLGSIPWIAALVTVSGIAVALWSARLERPRRVAIETATCTAN